MQITDFIVCGQNVKIYLDGEFWAEIPYLVAFDFRLQKGKQVDEELLASASQKSDEKTALEYSLRYLSRYSVSTKKMCSKLYEKGYKKPIVDIVIQNLIQLKYLDDYAFAENLVTKKSGKLGKIRLKSELANKGISSEIINEVLNCIDEDDTFSAAMMVAEKWYRSNKLETHADYQKFLRFMAYRGFEYDMINRCREELKFGKND